MSIALHTAALAAQMCLEGMSADEYMRVMQRQLRKSLRLATWLSRAMVTGPGRVSAPVTLTVFPDAMRWIAAATRIPGSALLERDGTPPHPGAAAFE
jgi:hypothetical protein